MFIHNFKYAFRTLLKSRMLIFWTFAFPIILGFLFQLAFSNIENTEKFDAVDIAVVNNKDYKDNMVFKEAFETLSDKENDDRLFNLQTVSEEKAKELLNKESIVGYVIIKDNKPEIVVTTNGVSQTILKCVVEEIEHTRGIVDTFMKSYGQDLLTKKITYNVEEIYNNILVDLDKLDIKIKDNTSKNLSYTMIEFYTLIAMTCMYGGMLGMVAINKCMPNMCEIGKRVTVSPTPKWVLILSSVLAGYITQLIGLALLFLFTIGVLKVDFGDNLGLVVLLALAGALAGLTLGIADATLFKASENSKTGLIVIISMVGSFLSGMMGITMKYVIDKNVPIVNILNPCSMITDGYYSLYYYDTLNKYIFNVCSLLIFSAIMIVASIVGIRRCRA